MMYLEGLDDLRDTARGKHDNVGGVESGEEVERDHSRQHHVTDRHEEDKVAKDNHHALLIVARNQINHQNIYENKIIIQQRIVEVSRERAHSGRP